MKFYTKKRRAPSIIIVSLIDILAILLIFFIVTASFKKDDPQLKINLPESSAGASAPAAKEPIVLDVRDAENITLDNTKVTPENLASALRAAVAAQPGRSLALRADRDAPFGVVVQVLDALREAGIENIPALTQPK